MIRFAPLRLAAAAMLVTVAACETVPVTGRSQFNVVDESTEQKLGEQAFAEIKAKSKISKDPAANAMVQRVGQRIAQASGLKENWEFIVIDEPQVNAFALPGGKIAVYVGILPVAGDDAGLATVLGHEVGHVMAHHAAERISQAQAIDVGTAIGSILLGGATGTDPNAVAGLLGAGAAVGLTLAVRTRAGIRGRPHRPDPDGARRLRSAGGGRLLAAHVAEERRRRARVPVDASRRRKPRRPHPAAVAGSARAIPRRLRRR